MHDAAGVQRREGGEDVEDDRHGRGRIDRAPPQPIGERLTLEQLHREEQLAVLFADLVNLADVRVAHARGRSSLAPETLARLRPFQARHRLERDEPVEALVPGGVDDTHAALADLAHDDVAADTSPHAGLRRPPERRRA